MGVNVRCEVCGTFIRRVETKDIGSIQTDEICDECDKKIKAIYMDFEETVAKFKIALNTLNTLSEKEFKTINSSAEKLYKDFITEFGRSNLNLKRTHEKYTNDIQGLFNTTNAEIGDKIRKMGRFFKREN